MHTGIELRYYCKQMNNSSSNKTTSSEINEVKTFGKVKNVSTDKLIYVYCLTNSTIKLFPITKFKGLKAITICDFTVIVKHVTENEFSEESFKSSLSDPKWLESKAKEHVDVISSIMETGTVLPFKFGTVFQTTDCLEKFIANNKESLTENYLIIDGKEEWSVKIYCDRKILTEQIDELSSKAALLEEQIMSSSPGKAYLLKLKKNDFIEIEMDCICKNKGQDYYNRFRDLSTSNSLNNLLPKELTGRDDTMILNATFLVNKPRVTDFKDTAYNMQQKDAHSGFFVEIKGSLPPFSFISIFDP